VRWLAFPLRDSFTDVWCVDAEPGMTEVVRAKAIAVGAAHIRTVTVGAEELPAGPDSFELIVIGNAFHRLRRAPTAGRAHTWLRPGGCLALCWSTSPWAGSQNWQRALAGVLRKWQNALGAAGRVPPGWDEPRQRDPDHDVLSRAGFEPAGRHRFPVEHHWTIRELAGHIRSTSFLPPPVLADHAAAFDAERRRTTPGAYEQPAAYSCSSPAASASSRSRTSLPGSPARVIRRAIARTIEERSAPS
jgi:hypothetical protein